MPRNLISQRWPSSCSWPWLNPSAFINTSSILRLEPLAFRRLGECTTTSSSPALALSRSTPFPSIELLLSTNHFVNLNEIILCQILWMILPYFLLQHSKCSIMSACFVSWYFSHATLCMRFYNMILVSTSKTKNWFQMFRHRQIYYQHTLWGCPLQKRQLANHNILKMQQSISWLASSSRRRL